MKKVLSLVTALSICGTIFSGMTAFAEDNDVEIIVEAEKYTWTENFPNGGIVEDEAASGGKYIEFQGSEMADGEYAAVYYNVFVPESGQYDIEIAASDLSSEYLSPWYLRVNGGEYFYSARESENASTNPKVKNYSVNMTLQAGKNEITIGVDQKRAAGDIYILRADYIKLVKTADADQGKLLEAENYLFAEGSVDTQNQEKDSSYKFASSASGGEYIIMDSGESAEYRVYSPYNGKFNIELTVNSFTLPNLADQFTMTVNDTEYVINADGSAVVSQYPDQALWGVAMYKMTNAAGITLNKGFNKVVISNTASNAKSLYLDCVTFVEMPANIAVEAESSADKTSTYKTSSFTSGSAYERMGSDGLYVANTFDVKVDGMYTLDMIIGAKIAAADSDYLGYVNIQIDDGEEMQLNADGTEAENFTDKNCTLEAVAYPDATDEAKNMKHYILDEPVYLTAGSHTITFRNALNPALDSGYANVFIDKFDFILNTEIAEAELTAPKNLLAIDESVETDFIAVSAEGVRIADEKAERSYSSSNPEIASVDADGIVTAHNPGKAVITATVIANGEETDISTEIRVVKLISDTPVVVQSVTKNEDSVKIDAFAAGDVTKSVWFIAAVFGVENGKQTSLKCAELLDKADFDLYNISSFTVPAQAETGDEVVLFTWQSDTLVPVCEAIKVE